ncbi:MAG: hypothetical protein IID28_10405 [Planctomycetes bacterium]|nr:hypothetical protein [Planctomycetota bacterium]
MNHRPVHNGRRHAGATMTEALVALVCLLAASAVMLPALGQFNQTVTVSRSMNKLRVLHEALECYAADWNDRQFTGVPDDLGVVGGSCGAYVTEFGCYPTLFAGLGCNGAFWAFWGGCGAGGSCQGNNVGTRPILFDPDLPIGVFRLPQVKPIHDYLDGRFYSPTFFARLDHKAFTAALPAFSVDCEFVEDVGTIPSSYMFSPAAMYHPDVLRAPSRGGFQHPDTFDQGYQSPSVTQVRHPGLKTWMMEHNWLRNPPAECNPDYQDIYGGFSADCDPYLFNHGADAEPLALFFDGSVEPLRTGDVAEDDAKVLSRTGGVDGLWSRDTPFGESGYFGDLSFDGIVVSHHVLTTGGILGRDRLRRPAATATGVAR